MWVKEIADVEMGKIEKEGKIKENEEMENEKATTG